MSVKPQLSREALTVLEAYEKWEADLLLRDEAWDESLPTIPQDLWDRLIEIQTMRNAVVREARG